MSNKHGRNWIRPERRLAIYRRDGFACLWCGTGIETAGTVLTLDHFKPRNRGGDNGNENLFTVCHACNSKRGDDFARSFAKSFKPAEADQIILAINRQRKRKIDVATAKGIIERRGWAGAVKGEA